MRTETKQTIATALALTLAVTGAAVAQDVIGAQPVSQAAITTFKFIAVAGVGWGFLRLMSGRHTVEGLTVMGAGALGLAKTQAIVGFLGLG
jgi:hypothetical protein